MHTKLYVYALVLGLGGILSLSQSACSDSSVQELKCPKGTEAYGGRPPLGNREYCGRPGPADSPESVTNHGPWRYWWPNGKLQHSGKYKDGQKHGQFTQWADTGG